MPSRHDRLALVCPRACVASGVKLRFSALALASNKPATTNSMSDYDTVRHRLLDLATPQRGGVPTVLAGRHAGRVRGDLLTG